MKTIVRITTDVMTNGAYDEHIEEIDYLVNEEVDCFCEIANKNYINLVEIRKRYSSSKEQYKNKTIVEARGYVQSEWQRFTIYHDLEDDNPSLVRLTDELEKSFTHMNDYHVEKFERETINGEDFDAQPHDYTYFSIRHIEFPEKEDVWQAYNEMYGKDYDEIIIEIE